MLGRDKTIEPFQFQSVGRCLQQEGQSRHQRSPETTEVLAIVCLLVPAAFNIDWYSQSFDQCSSPSTIIFATVRVCLISHSCCSCKKAGQNTCDFDPTMWVHPPKRLCYSALQTSSMHHWRWCQNNVFNCYRFISRWTGTNPPSLCAACSSLSTRCLTAATAHAAAF
eukprot:SAG31_NODE_6886_length_1860_cov_1.583759_2_plen_167_part_00